VAEFSGRLSKAPVIYVLCQIRFAPVLKMATHVPDIQERLRATYESFAEEQTAALQLITGTDAPTLKIEPRWRFDRPDRGAGCILHNGSFTYHTTSYTTFSDFAPAALDAFRVVAANAGIQYVQRVGLRYIDLIEEVEGVPVDELTSSQLRGFSVALEGITGDITQYMLSGSTSIGQLVFRATHGHHQLLLPPDLLPLSLKLSRTPDQAAPSLFLDTDHFAVRDTPPMGVGELEDILLKLKQPISRVFRAAITNRAVQLWK
jgi:uncharacterized protein (TIGR04255 family)